MSIEEQSLIYQNNISQPKFCQSKKYIYYIQKEFNTTAIYSYNIKTKYHQPIVVSPPPTSTLGYGGSCYTTYLDKIFYTSKDNRLYSLCLKSSKLDILSKDMSSIAHPIVSKNGKVVVFIGEKKDKCALYIASTNLSSIGTKCITPKTWYIFNPCLSNNGMYIAWQQWDREHMPWTCSYIIIAKTAIPIDKVKDIKKIKFKIIKKITT